MDPEATAHAAATQRLLAQLNEHLAKIGADIGHIRDALRTNTQLAAMGQDASYLAIRAMAEISVDFRTLLIRLAQEPAPNPLMKESREVLLDALAAQQRIAGERPTLKPVPPTK